MNAANFPHKDIHVVSKLSNHNFSKEWYEAASKNHFWMKWRLQAFLNQAYEHKIPLATRMTGVEIGCGEGVFCEQLEEISNWIIDGIELDYEALKKCKTKRGQLYYYDVLERNPQFKEKYDFIFLYDVLEHIHDTKPFIESCLFLLKPNGYLFVNTPALQKFHSAYDEAVGHVRRYNKAALENEFKPFHLNLVDIRYWGFNLLPFLAMRKLLTRKGQSNEEIFKKGFRPPSALINYILILLMKGETSVLKKPFLGTSVMAILKKI